MRNKYKHTSAFTALTLTVIAIVFLAAACSKGKDFIGAPAPPFSVPSFTGEVLSPAGYKGEPLLIYFFASW